MEPDLTDASDGGADEVDRYRALSLWWDEAVAAERRLSGTLRRRPSLPGDLDVDVAVVGGGFTGLWAARQLLDAERSLRVAVLEAEVCGYGASGRNGGWCSALFPASLGKLERMAGAGAASAMYRAMQATVDEVGRVAAAEGIDCHFAKGNRPARPVGRPA